VSLMLFSLRFVITSTIHVVIDSKTHADSQYDLFGALYRPNSTTDSAGHLGGIVAGLGAAMLFRKGRFPRGPRLR
jgi:membrane associated rhomboid family serine protease